MRVVVMLVVAGCTVTELDFTGKQCPCPEGYSCDPVTSTCTRSATNGDAATDTGDGSVSCLSAPFTNLTYSTATFADFTTAWSVGGGSWTQSGIEVVQSSSSASLSFIRHSVAGDDYRIVATMHATSFGAGRAIEIAFRIDAPNTNMYHCNWEPEGGGFILQRTDDINAGATIDEIFLDTNQIPNYTMSMPVTMELQASGSTFRCCLRGINGAELAGSDSAYATGDVGVKTYQMSGGFSDFFVYLP